VLKVPFLMERRRALRWLLGSAGGLTLYGCGGGGGDSGTAGSEAASSQDRISLMPQAPPDWLLCDDLTAWTFYNRNGRIVDGRVWIDGNYAANSIGRDGWAMTHVGDKSWTDYTYTLVANNVNAGGSIGYPQDAPMNTLFFRVLAQSMPGRYTTTYRLNLWATRLPPSGGCESSGNYMELEKYVDGQRVEINTDSSLIQCLSNAVVGTNSYEINVRGGTIEITVNGQLRWVFIDPDPIPYGGVGVGQIWETNGWFEDAWVAKIA